MSQKHIIRILVKEPTPHYVAVEGESREAASKKAIEIIEKSKKEGK